MLILQLLIASCTLADICFLHEISNFLLFSATWLTSAFCWRRLALLTGPPMPVTLMFHSVLCFYCISGADKPEYEMEPVRVVGSGVLPHAVMLDPTSQVAMHLSVSCCEFVCVNPCTIFPLSVGGVDCTQQVCTELSPDEPSLAIQAIKAYSINTSEQGLVQCVRELSSLMATVFVFICQCTPVRIRNLGARHCLQP